jgi:hypothetical protein
MRLALTVAAALAVGPACGKSEPPAPDCAAAAAAADRVAGENLKHVPAGKRDTPAVKARFEAMAAGYRRVLVTRCREDHWSAEMIRCMSSGTTIAAIEACRAKLSPDQLDKMNQAMRARKDEMLHELRP